jgi:phosphoenolpyruvate carboxylase
MSQEINELNKTLREKIQKATDTARTEKKYDGLKDEIKQAFTDYFSELQQHIPKYEKPVKEE